MRQACNVVVTERRDEDLWFMFEATESVGMYNSVSVALEVGSYLARFFPSYPATAIFAFGCVGRKPFLSLFNPLTDIKVNHHRALALVPANLAERWVYPTFASAAAIMRLVVSIISGVTDTEVIPHFTRLSVSSG